MLDTKWCERFVQLFSEISEEEKIELFVGVVMGMIANDFQLGNAFHAEIFLEAIRRAKEMGPNFDLEEGGAVDNMGVFIRKKSVLREAKTCMPSGAS